jgi:hypothetical protein
MGRSKVMGDITVLMEIHSSIKMPIIKQMEKEFVLLKMAIVS